MRENKAIFKTVFWFLSNLFSVRSYRSCASGSALIWVALFLLSTSAFADVSVKNLRHALPADDCTADPAADKWNLNGYSDYEPTTREGLPDHFDNAANTASAFCPDCLTDPRYAADEPLREIEKRKLPDGEPYTCSDSDGCQRWLFRIDPESDDALMLVHVGLTPACGASGRCPGLIYERRKSEWHLAGHYSSYTSDTLCLSKNDKTGLRFWITETANSDNSTTKITWKPSPSGKRASKP